MEKPTSDLIDQHLIHRQWIDCHSHLADPRLDQDLEQVMSRAVDAGFTFFMQGGVDPLDWKNQRRIHALYPGKIGLCFGLHPYFVAAHSGDECENALNELASQLHDAKAIGEMGLDFRPHIMKDSKSRQLDVFEEQIHLAEFTNKPMILHVVQAHYEAIRMFEVLQMPKSRGMVHGFNASSDIAREWVKKGFLLGIGGAITYSRNKKLQNAVKEMPLEFLCLESDSPDQPPEQRKGSLNEPQNILDVALKIGEIRGMSPSEVLKISTSNFQRIFGHV